MLFGGKRIRELEERIEKIERERKDLEMQWDSFYEKARRLLWRVAARKRDDTDAEQEVQAAEDDQVDAISARILKRRGHGVLPR